MGGGYETMSGTSMATPIVTGIAALIACKYKTLNGTRIPEMSLYDMLKQNTIDLEEAGIDNKTGAGFCTLNQGIATLNVTIDSQTIYVDGKPVIMHTKAILDANNRILAPIRPIGEGLGCFVTYDASTKTATIMG
jgi:major intracellular serine protease